MGWKRLPVLWAIHPEKLSSEKAWNNSVRHRKSQSAKLGQTWQLPCIHRHRARETVVIFISPAAKPNQHVCTQVRLSPPQRRNKLHNGQPRQYTQRELNVPPPGTSGLARAGAAMSALRPGKHARVVGWCRTIERQQCHGSDGDMSLAHHWAKGGNLGPSHFYSRFGRLPHAKE